MTTDECEGVYVMADTLVYLVLSLLLCGLLSRITALNQTRDRAKRSRENSHVEKRETPGKEIRKNSSTKKT